MVRLDIYHHFVNEPNGEKLTAVLTAIHALEKHMSKQDDAIASFQAKSDATLAALGATLDKQAEAQANIAADEAKILAELQNVDLGLTPENQAKLDAITANWESVATRAADSAAALQKLADSIPETPPATPPVA